MARIPEDRHAVGVIGDLPVWENAVSERLRSPAFSRWSVGAPGRGAAPCAHASSQAFDVRGGGPLAPARSLSGGNMQKLILGRALLAPEGDAAAPRLIVAHQPTWGLDIGAVAYVQQQLIAARDAGAAVLLISDDLDEVMTLGDRIAVMHARPPHARRAPRRRGPAKASAWRWRARHEAAGMRLEKRIQPSRGRPGRWRRSAPSPSRCSSARCWCCGPARRSAAPTRLLLQGGFGSVFALERDADPRRCR